MSRSATGLRAKRAAFLEELAKHGVVGPAATVAGIDRRTAYRWREADPAFADAWVDAVEDATDLLEREVIRRVADGVPRPVFYQGEVCGEVREFSDSLAALILKARRPAVYRERFDVEHSGIPQSDAATVAAAASELLARFRDVRPDDEAADPADA